MRQGFLVSMSFALVLSASAMAQAWSEHENRQEGWMINFPGEPKLETRPYMTASGAMATAKVQTVEIPSGTYSFTFV